MFLELALVLPFCLSKFCALIRYRHVIKAVMTSPDNLLPTLTDEGFDDDKPKEGVPERKKSETLKDAI